MRASRTNRWMRAVSNLEIVAPRRLKNLTSAPHKSLDASGERCRLTLPKPNNRWWLKRWNPANVTNRCDLGNCDLHNVGTAACCLLATGHRLPRQGHHPQRMYLFGCHSARLDAEPKRSATGNL